LIYIDLFSLFLCFLFYLGHCAYATAQREFAQRDGNAAQTAERLQIGDQSAKERGADAVQREHAAQVQVLERIEQQRVR